VDPQKAVPGLNIIRQDPLFPGKKDSSSPAEQIFQFFHDMYAIKNSSRFGGAEGKGGQGQVSVVRYILRVFPKNILSTGEDHRSLSIIILVLSFLNGT
jgi:hypothetical protein